MCLVKFCNVLLVSILNGVDVFKKFSICWGVVFIIVFYFVCENFVVIYKCSVFVVYNGWIRLKMY